MRSSTFEIKIDRVIVVGAKLNEAHAHGLRTLIEEEMREKMASIRKPVHPFKGEAVRIDLPGLSLDTVEGVRRVARASADAVVEALRGKST
jgi:hypothetical protein